MRYLVLPLVLLFTPQAWSQTVVEMDLPSARLLLKNHRMDAAQPLLTNLANNYKQYTNIRVHSARDKAGIKTLARALRTDFDGSGRSYVPELTIWAIRNEVGGITYLTASLMDRSAVLLTNKLDYIKGMLAYEILHMVKSEEMSLHMARRKALLAGIEMQVDEDEDGKRSISFFGHNDDSAQLVGKLIVIEPPDFVW
jgi:hypothetical protein